MSIYIARPTIMYDNTFNFREVFAVEAFKDGEYVQYAGVDRLRFEPGQRVLTGTVYEQPTDSKLAIADKNTMVSTLEAEGWKILNKF